MHEEHLAAAFHLPQDSLAHQPWAVRPDVSNDRQAFRRRCVDHRNIPHPGKRHVQRAGDGCGSQREHVDFGAQLLEVFLVGHTEALFFVNDQQAQVLELHIRLDQAMRADDNVHLAPLQALQDGILLLRGAEAAEHLHFHREGRQALAEGLEMLLGEHSGGYQQRHLLAVHHRLERRPQGDLSLAVAHIAAQQAVHGPRGFHILLHRPNGFRLILGLNIREAGFQLLLPDRVRAEGMSLCHLPLCVQLEQLLGHIKDSFADFLLGLRPVSGSQPGHCRRRSIRPDVAAQPVRLVHGHKQLISGRVLHHQELAGDGLERALHQPDVAADAVVHVNHVVTRLQVRVGRFRRLCDGSGPPAGLRTVPAEHFAVSQQVELPAARPGQRPAFAQRAFQKHGMAGQPADFIPLCPQLAQPADLPGDQQELVAAAAELLHVVHKRLELPRKPRSRREHPRQRTRLFLLSRCAVAQLHPGVAVE